MPSFQQKSAALHALHTPSDPLILWNIWDAGSARTVATTGAKAIATGSLSVAGALGYDDGEQCPREQVLRVLESVCRVTDLPVTHDAERGYGEREEDVRDYISEIVRAGAVGINLEDGLACDGIRLVEVQSARLSAAKAALGEGVLNARTDVFLRPDARDTGEKIEETVSRADAYRRAGADGLFVPGLLDRDVIGHLAKRVELPLNIMRAPDGLSLSDLAALGVSRISHGPFPWLAAMEGLKQQVAAN